MNRKTTIIVTIILILALGSFRLVNPKITKELVAIDCKVTYQESIFARQYEGYNVHNAKMDLAKCLCSKYSETRHPKYESEIKKILSEFDYDYSVDQVCADTDAYLLNRYYE